MNPFDDSEALQAAVRAAFEQTTALNICGGGTKAFLGRAATGETLSIAKHRGIIAYEPSELVLTARGGTTLTEIETALSDAGQEMPFEPPRFGPASTIGGAIAAGLGGPARPYAGAPRDFVLGVRIINGRGDDLRFGGQVMKNVAGYDISRLMTGALGTLGVILEVSLKVLPTPRAHGTVQLALGIEDALSAMTTWAREPLPINGTLHDGKHLYVRFAGAQTAVDSTAKRLGGERVEGTAMWASVRDHTHSYFNDGGPLWRLVLPDGCPVLPLAGQWLTEWGGTQRWLRAPAGTNTAALTNGVRALVAKHGGHATFFRGGDRTSEIFQPLSSGLMTLHKRLKHSFDPAGILNPGRLYAGL
ncbi:MAG: glycolate oxidase FAD binding subunit [Gammaproteobacteria bacterium]|jgi:glycolate oxidase FAD binding subunit